MGKADLTRDLIIDRSIPIFNTKGYHATSISDITKATGITKGAIYGNFKNKDEVASSAFDKASRIVFEQLAKRIQQQPTAPLKLRAIVDYYAEYVNNPPIEGGCPILNTSVEADDNHPVLRAKVVRRIGQIKEDLSKIVYRGIKEGQIKDNLEVEPFVTFFYATINGAVLLARAEGDDRSYGFIHHQLMEMINQISL